MYTISFLVVSVQMYTFQCPYMVNYQLPFILTAALYVACLYQAMMTLLFLNDVANDNELTQKSKITS